MTDLTDRMRTCAARILDLKNQGGLADPHMIEFASHHAAELLTEAAAELEKPIEVRLGEPMKVIEAIAKIEPPPTNFAIDRTPQGFWYDDALRHQSEMMHQPSRNACPNCDSRATKTVHVLGKTLELECPVCGMRWQR